MGEGIRIIKYGISKDVFKELNHEK